MTPAERNLIVAMCERAAECWAEDHTTPAEKWFEGAVYIADRLEFIDTDAEADR